MVVELSMLEGVHRDRHDGSRRLLEQRAFGMQGVSVFGGASVGGMWVQNKDLCAVVTFVNCVRLAQ